MMRSCYCLLTVCVGFVAVWIAYDLSVSQDGSERYRFGSFAPVRMGSQAKWFVDGQDYMSAVADTIMAAKYEIFIADWQMNPHIFMKRPDNGITSLESRLDRMLLKKAEEGVRVYILLYWETKINADMDLGSDYAQSILRHKNIEVYRHPTFYTPVSNPKTLLRWSHHEKVVVVDRIIAFVGGIDLCFGRWDTHSHELHDDYPLHPCVLGKEDSEHSVTEEATEEATEDTSKEPIKKYRRWIGKDYGNTLLGVVRTKFNEPFQDYINRKNDPRMPWHDVSCMFNGDPALDVARHFIQRYNAINHENSWLKFWNRPQLSIENWNHPDTHDTIPDPSASDVNIQVLRSVGSWSAEQPHEDSIHQAYLHAIKNAEHFIYIENQYFISSQPKEIIRNVQNAIQLALCDRIARAYLSSENFHVLILLPLQPEFSDEWGTGGPKDSVSYWNYATLYRGEDSLFHKLKKIVPEEYLHRYLSVYSLRTHDILGDRIVTEIIYVHSKLMIVDDRLAIIGSANINDRSMLGDRDSEVDVIIEDKNLIDGKINGLPYRVGKFSHGLRCHLLKEHLGLLDEENWGIDLEVEDPLADDFYAELLKIASTNTEIYETVFFRKIIPTNPKWTFEDMKEWQTIEGLADRYPDEAKEELSNIRGRIVLFPPLHLYQFFNDVVKPSNLDYLNMFVDNRNVDDRKTMYV